MNIVILTGGQASEVEISLRSADTVRRALQSSGHTVQQHNIADGLDSLADYIDIDLIMPILHGVEGESGTLQRHLEKHLKDYNIPYFGSGPDACNISFDKTKLKEVLLAKDIVTPEYEVVTEDSFSKSPLIKKPFVLKPLDEGSSIDTYIERDPNDFDVRKTKVFSRHKHMLLEELIDGQEITVGVLDNEALPVVEIIPPKEGEFDFINKYNGATQELCPPKNISSDIQQRAQELALKIHTFIDARHLSRTDMIVRGDELYVLELNTIPGLTEQSLFPKAAAAAGLSMEGLVQRFVELTLSDESSGRK